MKEKKKCKMELSGNKTAKEAEEHFVKDSSAVFLEK